MSPQLGSILTPVFKDFKMPFKWDSKALVFVKDFY